MEAALTCRACGFDNREGSRFCGGCGASLEPEVTCAACGTENPPGQPFCNACGAKLAATEAAPAATAEPPAAAPPVELPEHLARKASADASSLVGERKLVTVVFADVLGSMDLAERTDPERWQEIMNGFFGVLAEAVHRFEGTVDKFTGDGIMALFGAPIAHEDHAARACYAALEMQRAVGEYAAELRRAEGISLTARIGLNSGEVVVGAIGEGGEMSYTAVGHTVGLAQRMEALAEPGKAYLTVTTAELAAGFLELSDLGEFDVKGASAPVRVHELVGVGSARGRLDIARQRGFSRFVGRNQELATLEGALEQAAGGNGSVVGIVADAGIGKSRLCHEFVESVRARGIEVYEAQAQAHGRSLPLLPVLQMLRGYFGIMADDQPRTVRERIAGRLLLLDASFEEDLGLLFEFLGVPDPERPVPQMNPEARQRRLLAMVKRLVHARAREGVAVNLVEDLHWIDPASEAFLTALVDAVPGTKSLLVANFRPEYQADWMRRSHYRRIPLLPLSDEALHELIVGLLGADPSLDGLAELIAEQTGGNPFFVEECIRELAESGALAGERGTYRLVGQIEEIAVPPTVQNILAARIDRLSSEAKGALQAGAAIGAEFTVAMLALALEAGEGELDAALAELADAEFVYETEIYPEREYAFRHPLTREVAYNSQLASTRARVHAAIARGLQEHDPERLDERAGEIALHFERAGEAMDAATWHARAAGWAGFNNPQAAREHWQRICELDPELPPGEDGDRVRLTANLMMLATGWRLGADVEEARRVFERGQALAEGLGDHGTRAILHGGIGITEATCGGDVPAYLRHVERSRELEPLIEDPSVAVVVAGNSYYANWLSGRLPDALASLDRILELTADDPMLGAGVTVQNPRAWATAFRAACLTLVGRFDEGRHAVEEGMRLCERFDQESLGWSYGFAVFLAYKGANTADAETLAASERSVAIAESIGDGFSAVLAYWWRGLSRMLLGDDEAAIPDFDRALQIVGERGVGLESEPAVQASRARARARIGEGFDGAVAEAELGHRLIFERGVRVYQPLVCADLAETLLIRAGDGDLERARAVLDEAERLARELGMLPDVTTVLRLRALVSDRLGDSEARDRDREAALALGRELGAEGTLAGLEADMAAPGAR